jgi:hypothetical protein
MVDASLAKENALQKRNLASSGGEVNLSFPNQFHENSKGYGLMERQ